MYAEAYVTVHQYDIVLDVTVINRTDATMQVSAHAPPSHHSAPEAYASMVALPSCFHVVLM